MAKLETYPVDSYVGTQIQRLALTNSKTAAYYGVTGNGTTDDTAALNTAIQAIADEGGGVLDLGAGTFRITAPLNINDHNVVLRGRGCGGFQSGISQIRASAASRIFWDGSVGQPMVHFEALLTDQSKSAGGLYDVMLDCMNIADDGLLLTSWSRSRFENIVVYAATRNGVRLTTQPTNLTAQPNDCWKNAFYNVYTTAKNITGNNMTGLRLGKGGTKNSCYNMFYQCTFDRGEAGGGEGIILEDTDNNIFYAVSAPTLVFGSEEQDTNGVAANSFSRYNMVFGAEVGTVTAKASVGGSGHSRDNLIVGLNNSNGSGAVVIESGATLFVLDVNEWRTKVKMPAANFAPQASAPTPAVEGDVYYNSTTNRLQVRGASSWEDLSAGVPGAGIPADTADVEQTDTQVTFVGGFIDDANKMPLGITKQGEIAWSKQRVLPSDVARYGYPLVYAIADKTGQLAFGIKKNAEIMATLDKDSFLASEAKPLTTLEKAYEAGARGQISRPRNIDAYAIGYDSDIQDGVTLPYVVRTDTTWSSPQVLNTDEYFEVHVSNGQSWRTDHLDASALSFISSSEAYTAFGFGSAFSTGSLLPINSIAGGTTENWWDDICGLDMLQFWEAAGITTAQNSGAIDIAATVATNRLRRRSGYPVRPIFYYNHGWPGTSWNELKPGGTPDGTNYPWQSGLNMAAKFQEYAAIYKKRPVWRSVGWTQGGNASTDYALDLADLVATYNAAGFPLFNDQPLQFFIDQRPPLGTETVVPSVPGGYTPLIQSAFAISNSQTHMIGPRYPYAYRDNIHHGALEYVLLGELEALARHVVLDLGETWDSFRPTSVAATGSTVTITVTQPTTTFFSTTISRDTSFIEAATNDGFTVKVNSVTATISSVTFPTSTTIELALSASTSPGDTVEVSYAFYGPGGKSGVHSGCWGNIKREGPDSVLLTGYTVDAWLEIFLETVTAT